VQLRADSEAGRAGAGPVLFDLLGRPSAWTLRRGDGPDPGPLCRPTTGWPTTWPGRPVQPWTRAPSSSCKEAGASNISTGLGRLAVRTVGVSPTTRAATPAASTATSGDRPAASCSSATASASRWSSSSTSRLPARAVQEDDGVPRRGAKLLHAYAAASVPRLTSSAQGVRRCRSSPWAARASARTACWPGRRAGRRHGRDRRVEVLHRRELAAERDLSARAALVLRLAAHHEATTGGLRVRSSAAPSTPSSSRATPARPGEQRCAELGDRRGAGRQRPL
jgi:acetyl-CoA/propionyl-CoA carboxylase carboxyl transferase subunit